MDKCKQYTGAEIAAMFDAMGSPPVPIEKPGFVSRLLAWIGKK